MFGCLSDATVEEEEEQEGEVPDLAVLGATTNTAQFPAIGQVVGGCTATLISPRVILSASHCFPGGGALSGLGDAANAPTFSNASNGTFRMYGLPGSNPATMDRTIRRVAYIHHGYGTQDLAVAELDADVPARFATPLDYAVAEPSNNERVTAYGYGCTAGDGTTGMWRNTTFPRANAKTVNTSTWNNVTHTTNTNLNCQGDSGGPTLNSSNQIVAIHSSGGGNMGATEGTDGNGLVYKYYRWIDSRNAIYGNRQTCRYCPKITLKTNDGVHYLQATNGGGSTVTAASTSRGSSETFRVVNLAANAPEFSATPWLALQASNGQWLSARNGGGSTLSANRDVIGASEVFRGTRPASLFALTARSTTPTSLGTSGSPTKFVAAENGGGGAVNVNRASAGVWETFTAALAP